MDKFVTMENMEALLPLIKQRFQNIENRLPIFIYKYFEPGVTDTNTGSVIRLNDKYMNQVISIEDDVVITSLAVKMNNEDITKQAYTGPFSAEILGRVEGEEASYLRQGDSYSSGEITPDAGWGIKSMRVEMGDDDITSESLSGHEVSVADVRGDIAVEVETACEVVSTPFLSRITANGLTLANNRALLKGIQGNTLVWNQKVASSTHITNIGLTMDYANGILTVSGTAASNSTIAAYPRFTSVTGHIYYVYLNGTHNFDRLVIGSSGNLPTTLSPIRVTWNATTNAAPNLYVTSGQTYSASFKYYVIDLTAMFGAGNEPTLAEFEALYPLGNYATDAGRLIDFNGETLRSVGFNLWDEEWDIGSIGAHGVLTTGSYLRSKNAIPVLPSAQYYMTKGNNIAWVYFYGAGGEYLEAPFAKLNVGSGSFTTPAGTYYIRFLVDTTYGTTYKNNICINLSNTSLNGTYKPYSAQDITINPTAMYGYLNGEGEAVQIFPSGMRSAGSVSDEVYKEDGKWYAKVNVGSVELGELTWALYPSKTSTFRSPTLAVEAWIPSLTTEPRIVASKYQPNLTNNIINKKEAGIGIYQGRVVITDTAYTDADTFKDSLDNVMLNYYLATPRTYLLTDEWQQILNTAYQVETGGMEIILPENGSEPTTSPAKMEIQYGTDGTENN